MISIKKTLIATAISTSICASSASLAVVGDYTGGFLFVDAGGADVGLFNTTVYGLATDPGTLSQPFQAGGLDFSTKTGFFTDDTLFNGNQFVTDVDTMFFYDPAGAASQTFTYTWTNRTFDDGSFTVLASCRTGVSLNGCAALEADPSLSELGSGSTNSYTLTLTAEGQYALGLFFDWSTNADIPVLSGHQITAYDSNTNSITIGQSLDIGDNFQVDADGDGVVDGPWTGIAGTAMKTSPFPGQTPTFNGTIEVAAQSVLAPTITIATTPAIAENSTYAVTLSDVNVTASSTFPANLYNLSGLTIQAQDGTGYTRSGNTITPTVLPPIGGTIDITVPVTVTDARFGQSAPGNLVITVTPVQDAPVISDIYPDTAVVVNTIYTYSAFANDADEDNVTYAVTSGTLPSWLSLNTITGELSGTAPSTAGTAVTGLVITATDDSLLNLSDTIGPFDITVVASNTLPTLTGTPASTIAQDSTYLYTPTISDDDTYRVSISGQPSWATFNTSTGVLSGTPTNSDVGTYTGINITVIDKVGETASTGAFTIDVTNVNDRPIISGTPTTALNTGESYNFAPSAGDIDVGDTISFSITGKPSWATFDTTSGDLSGTPSATDFGVYSSIVITVQDDSGAGNNSASLPAFTITVNGVPVAENGLFSTAVDTDTSGIVIANDPESSSLTYTKVSESNGVATLNATDGTFTFTPDTGFEGSAGFTYTVNDGTVNSNEATITILVGDSGAAEYKGSNFTMLDATGANAQGGANDVAATWNGVTTTDLADTNFSNMTIASATPFFGNNWTAHHIRVFGPGDYTFDTSCTNAELETAGTTQCSGTGTPISMSVGPNQIGVHILFDWSTNKNIDVVNVYDINSTFTTSAAGSLYKGVGFGPYPWSGAPADDTQWRLVSTDNDGDGIAGVPMVDGDFAGFSANFNLDITQSDSNFTMLDATGANAQGGANDVAATWNGVTTTDPADTNFSNMTIASSTPFFGNNWTAHHIRVFGPGDYTFDTSCTNAELETAGTTQCSGTGTPISMSVGPNQIGVHILFDWSTNKNIDVVNVYDINAEFTTSAPGALYTGVNFGSYPWSGAPAANTKWRLASTDNDGDGIAGVPMVDGDFAGFSANFNLFVASGSTVELKPEPHTVDTKGAIDDLPLFGSINLYLSSALFSIMWLLRRRTRV